MNKADINSLKSPPLVAWPTLILFIICTLVLGVVWYACIAHNLSLWIGMLINGITAYFLFSVVHDSSHHSVSRNKLVNEALGRIGLIYFAPLAPMDVARYIHMAHHRHTNDPKRDPDAFGHRLDWLFPLRWLNFDYFYAKWFFKHGGDFARRKYGALALYVAFILCSCAAIIWAGYGLELLMLWFIPTRISSFLFVLVFSYLTHQPFEVLGRDSEYKATAVRLGADWFWGPLMTNHNYHLIHHLYPNAPFYNYRQIWAIKGGEIMAHQPLMPPTFGLSKSAGSHE